MTARAAASSWAGTWAARTAGGPIPGSGCSTTSRTYIPPPSLRQEHQRHREADDGQDRRVPKPRIDVARRSHDRERGRGQEAAEPAIADVIRQGERRIAGARRGQLP